MRSRLKLRAGIVSAWIVVAALCAFGQRSAATVRDRDLAEQARAILNQRCFQCHGANGVAQKNVFVLDRSRLVASKIVVPGDSASLLLRVVETGAMPAVGPPLNEDEKAILKAWVLNGAPGWSTASAEARAFLSEPAILAAIREDLAATPARERTFIRYFSIANLYNAGVSDSDLDRYRSALSKLINSLSWHPEITPPAPIDQARTIFRIDLRDYNWSLETWNVLLAAYPYGIRASDAETINNFSGARIPYLRADWFVANACLPPLYHEILGLPEKVADLERMLGIDTARNLSEEKNVVRAGLRSSGVSQNNRILERHVSTHGAYWKSFDFRGNTDDQNIFRDPLHFREAGSEIIFNLPNGLQAYFLANGSGSRLNQAPIAIVADRNNPDDPVIHNGRSCMNCHFAGMQSFKDDVRSVVSTMNTDQFDRQRALFLYPPQGTLDRVLDKDLRRFQTALVQTGGPLPQSAGDEPINALSRRFNAELPVSEAAAEAGLEASEFMAQLGQSPRLLNLGFGQLMVAGGGIKRDIWERQFGDVVRELRLGDHIPARLNVSQALVTAPRFRLADSTATRSFARPPLSTSSPAATLRSARTIFIMSRTVHFKPDNLANELLKKPEFAQMGLSVTTVEKLADLKIEVDRLAFTTEFTYVVVDPGAGTVLTSGQVNSLFGTVPGKIAVDFMKRLQAARSASTQWRKAEQDR